MLLYGSIAPMRVSEYFVFGQCTGSSAFFALLRALRLNMKALSTLLKLLQTITARIAAWFGDLQQTGIKGVASRPSYTHQIISPVSWLDLCYPLFSFPAVSFFWCRLRTYELCVRILGLKGVNGRCSISHWEKKDRWVSANIYNPNPFSIGFVFHLACNSLVGPQKPVPKSHLSHTRKVKLTS